MVGIVVGSLIVIMVSALVLWWASASKRGTLRRNHILGYRTPFTLSDDVWVTVNRAIAPFLFVAGIGAVVGAVLALVVGLIGAPEAGAIVVVGSVVWIFVWLVLTLIPAHARARTLKQRAATAR